MPNNSSSNKTLYLRFSFSKHYKGIMFYKIPSGNMRITMRSTDSPIENQSSALSAQQNVTLVENLRNFFDHNSVLGNDSVLMKKIRTAIAHSDIISIAKVTEEEANNELRSYYKVVL